MPASALRGRQPLSGRNWGAFDVRTTACVRSATSWQRRQLGSRGRARRTRTGLSVHERAPGHVSLAYNGPRPEGFGLGLLRLAELTRFGSGDRQRRSDTSYPHDPRRIAWNLWPAACSRRTEGRWPLCWPEADCSADASGRDRGRQPAQKRTRHDAAGDRPSSRQRSRPPQLHGRAAERVVGGRHHLPADVGRLSLPRGRSRRLVAPDRRMGLLGRSEDPRRARRPRHGARGPKARQCRPSFGSWFATHLGRFRQPLQGSRRSSIDDELWRLQRERRFEHRRDHQFCVRGLERKRGQHWRDRERWIVDRLADQHRRHADQQRHDRRQRRRERRDREQLHVEVRSSAT